MHEDLELYSLGAMSKEQFEIKGQQNYIQKGNEWDREGFQRNKNNIAEIIQHCAHSKNQNLFLEYYVPVIQYKLGIFF